MVDDPRAFTAERVRALTGLTKRRLQYWDEQNFIRPSLTARSGRGRRRLYDFRDLVSLRLAASLRADGTSLQEIRKVDRHLRQLDYEKPLAQIPMWRCQGHLYFSESEANRAGKRPEQIVMFARLPFKAALEALEAELAEERPTGRVERRRGTLGNQPVIAGTRITAASIQRLTEDGLDAAQIRELYPDLTAEDIEAARAVGVQRPTSRAS